MTRLVGLDALLIKQVFRYRAFSGTSCSSTAVADTGSD